MIFRKGKYTAKLNNKICLLGILKLTLYVTHEFAPSISSFTKSDIHGIIMNPPDRWDPTVW